MLVILVTGFVSDHVSREDSLYGTGITELENSQLTKRNQQTFLPLSPMPCGQMFL